MMRMSLSELFSRRFIQPSCAGRDGPRPSSFSSRVSSRHTSCPSLSTSPPSLSTAFPSYPSRPTLHAAANEAKSSESGDAKHDCSEAKLDEKDKKETQSREKE